MNELPVSSPSETAPHKLTPEQVKELSEQFIRRVDTEDVIPAEIADWIPPADPRGDHVYSVPLDSEIPDPWWVWEPSQGDYEPEPPIGEPTTYAHAFDRLHNRYSTLEQSRINANLAGTDVFNAMTDARLASEAAEFLNVKTPFHRGTGGWTPKAVARRELEVEISLIMRISEGRACILLNAAETIAAELPLTQQLLSQGVISVESAVIVARFAKELPPEMREEFEKEVVPVAERGTLGELRSKSRKVREVMHPDPLIERQKEAMEKRCVTIEPAADGMAWLTIFLAAPEAYAIHNRITDTARSMQGPEEKRTLPQLRTDVFSDLLINGDSNKSRKKGIHATVFITVPVMSLLGHSTELAALEGYGPIDVETARRLTADANAFIRVLTDPITGTVLGVGARRKVPQAMRDQLRLRDETCRFPGCRRSAGSCELDHTVDWQFTHNTAVDNLAHLCKRHHQLKTYTDVGLSQGDHGELVWLTPTKREYTDEPATVITFIPTAPLASDNTEQEPAVGTSETADVAEPIDDDEAEWDGDEADAEFPF